MGNCGSNPKTNEGPDEPLPEPVTQNNKEVKVEQQEEKEKAQQENVVEANTEEIPISTHDNSLLTLLNEKKDEVEKAEAEVVKEEVPKEQEPKLTTEEVKIVQEAVNSNFT